MHHRSGIFAALVLLALAAVSTPAATAEVNVYSARKEYLIKPLLDRFTERTGAKVNLVTAGAGPLLKRLEAEGRNSPADLFITTDAGRLHQARLAGVLQPVTSAALAAAVPAELRDPDGYWYGLSRRVRPVMYAKGRVDPATLSTYEALAEPRWKNRICVRSSDNIYNQSLVASMIVANGEAPTLAWLEGLVANFARPPHGGDRDQIRAVAAGECDVTLANNYYLLQMLASDDAAERDAARAVAIFWPNPDGRGAHVNVSGAGVTAAAKHRDDARALLEFLVSPESQAWYAEVNYEYPVRSGVAPSAALAAFGEFRGDTVNLARLGELNAAAVKLMDRAGWR